ncbi:HupE/UreJ family protein [Methyloglobulus sp.]|uniref:HupE/UreJ family protein n=1 Tax=Methyloglobulus sp. TaxID=2518622 RepID=UPI0032B8823B
MKTFKNTVLTAALFGFTTPALAHTGIGATHDFIAGMMHPWQGFDHLLVMFTIGLWGYLLAGKLAWQLPLVFLILMLAGAGLHFAGFTLSFAETWVSLSVVVFGLILVFNPRLSAILATGLVAGFAIFHGYVHAAEIARGADQFGYVVGFLLSTAVLHGLGISTGWLSAKITQYIQLRPASRPSFLYSIIRFLPKQHFNH